MPKSHHVERYFEDVPRPVIARGTDYPDGHVIPPHHHRRGQLLYGSSGVVMAATSHGAWVMPPQRGMWIPAGVEHEVRMLGLVRMRSLYFEPDAVAMPDTCQVVGISPFMRGLIAEAVKLPRDYDEDGRGAALMALIRHEMRELPILPLSIPLPTHAGLARRCREFLANPTSRDTIDAWCGTLNMSRRTFTRLFRQQTGSSFVAWRQQACLVAAMPRLAAGEPVTKIALDFGYDNPSAFAAMFKRLLGSSPRAYREEIG